MIFHRAIWPRERAVETELGWMYLPRNRNGTAEDYESCVSLLQRENERDRA